MLFAVMLALRLLAQASPVVSVVPFQQAVIEGWSYTFVVTRTGDLSGALTVNFMIGNSADPSLDYQPTIAPGYPAYGQLTFNPNEETKFYTFTSRQSGRYRPVFFQFQLVDGAGYTLGAPNAAITGFWTVDQYKIQCQLGFATIGCTSTANVQPSVN